MTITSSLTDVVSSSLGAVRTLERYGLDYCCGGKQPFDEVCHAKGLTPNSVMAEIEQALASGGVEKDWQSAPLGDLARHIVATRHEYLKLELATIGNRLRKVHAVHGVRDPETLDRMLGVFGALREEMELHMHKEEAILFPFIEQYGRAEEQGQPMPSATFGSIANPIAMMEREHVSAGDALGELGTLTQNSRGE